MALHTLNKSPQHRALLDACLNAINAGDALLLLQDGVYAALRTDQNTRLFADSVSGVTLFALQEDLLARGLTGHLMPNFTTIDYAGFVELACLHSKTVSWF